MVIFDPQTLTAVEQGERERNQATVIVWDGPAHLELNGLLWSVPSGTHRLFIAEHVRPVVVVGQFGDQHEHSPAAYIEHEFVWRGRRRLPGFERLYEYEGVAP